VARWPLLLRHAPAVTEGAEPPRSAARGRPPGERQRGRDPRGAIDVEDDDIEEGELFERIAAAYETKYGNRPFGAFAFRPHVSYAWREDFTGSATRYAFD